MSMIKVVLCVLVMIAAYGVVGTQDYEDAVRTERAYAQRAQTHCLHPVTESPPRGFNTVRAVPSKAGAGAISIEACDDHRDRGASHADRN